MANGQHLVDDVARIRLYAHISVKTRLDDQPTVEPEFRTALAVVVIEVLQSGHRAAELDRASRIEVALRVTKAASLQRHPTVLGDTRHRDHHLQAMLVRTFYDAGATIIRAQQRLEIQRTLRDRNGHQRECEQHATTVGNPSAADHAQSRGATMGHRQIDADHSGPTISITAAAAWRPASIAPWIDGVARWSPQTTRPGRTTATPRRDRPASSFGKRGCANGMR